MKAVNDDNLTGIQYLQYAHNLVSFNYLFLYEPSHFY